MSARPPYPSDFLNRTVQAAADLVEVADVRCTARAAPPGEPEAAGVTRLILPRRGVFSVTMRDRLYFAEPGTAVILLPDEPYRFGHPAPGGDDCTLLVLRPVLWAEASEQRSIPVAGAFVRASMGLYHGTLRLHRQGGRLEPAAVEEAALGYLEKLLPLTNVDAATGYRSTPSRRRLALAAVDFLTATYPQHRHRLLDDAAQALGCSPYHLARVFRGEVGVTLHGFRSRLRIASALESLADTGEGELAELAHSLGYASHSHFTDSFRAATGVSPRHARAGFRKRGR